MYSFNHITEATFDVKPANLPQGAKLSQRERKVTDAVGNEVVKVTYVVHLTEQLTVPTTAADLVKLAETDTETVQMLCGETKVTMTQACADYVRGRKLRSNQDMQAVLRGDGKASTRGDALAFWSGLDTEQQARAMASVIGSVRSKDAGKAHNAKLDRISELLAAGDKEQAAAVARE